MDSNHIFTLVDRYGNAPYSSHCKCDVLTFNHQQPVVVQVYCLYSVARWRFLHPEVTSASFASCFTCLLGSGAMASRTPFYWFGIRLPTVGSSPLVTRIGGSLSLPIQWSYHTTIQRCLTYWHQIQSLYVVPIQVFDNVPTWLIRVLG